MFYRRRNRRGNGTCPEYAKQRVESNKHVRGNIFENDVLLDDLGLFFFSRYSRVKRKKLSKNISKYVDR